MKLNAIFWILFLVLQACDITESDHKAEGTSAEPPREISTVANFSLTEALKNKDFEDFYLLMSRSTHNMYELEKGVKNRPMYQTIPIDSVAKLLHKLPKNALRQTYGFRDGMESVAFTIPDFIIRRLNGSEEEKIKLLEELKAKGLTFDMYFISYPEWVFYGVRENVPTEAIPYIEMLKEGSHGRYPKILSFLKSLQV